MTGLVNVTVPVTHEEELTESWVVDERAKPILTLEVDIGVFPVLHGAPPVTAIDPALDIAIARARAGIHG
jgi:hypothetical protein